MTSTKLAVEAWEALFRTQASLVRRFAEQDVWAPEHGVGLREYDVLYTLTTSVGGRARLGALADAVLLPQPSLSRLVDRLVAQGLLQREPDPADRRGVVLVLTDAGRAVQREVGRRHAAAIADALGEHLDDDELAALRELCRKVLPASSA
ncbi:transcriptional regulator, MarR family [Quadrisphaera granulorum]|uniref:MarR family transcriptional regulator n=1 Tax=Quadrisphaera granulorum TaxID=317664 RepID=A0A316ACG2_9ACTN|nr:MarR family transcriptional regulator [Quadrisphaera granulorum]PWJ54584.1 MarR family transcriptional regulator [Quadrisphaera granulorum]SZE95946.1 transcriptional regulator, MarR family [Quadrisphaera granulorum]